MIVVAAGRGKPGGGGLFPGFFPGDALRAMALTLRPSDVDRSRWIAFDGGIPIGRIYQRHTPASADVAWFWSIITGALAAVFGLAAHQKPQRGL